MTPFPKPVKRKKLINVKKMVKLAEKINSHGKIERLDGRSVKLSSTLGGQRELMREMKNKINEIINYLNENRSSR